MWLYEVLVGLSYVEITRLRLVSRLFYRATSLSRKSIIFWRYYFKRRNILLTNITSLVGSDPSKYELLLSMRTLLDSKTITEYLAYGRDSKNADLIKAYLSQRDFDILQEVIDKVSLMLGYKVREGSRSRTNYAAAVFGYREGMSLKTCKACNDLTNKIDIAVHNLLVDMQRVGETIIIDRDRKIHVFNIETDISTVTPIEFIVLRDMTSIIKKGGISSEVDILLDTVKTPISSILEYLQEIGGIKYPRDIREYVTLIYRLYYHPQVRDENLVLNLRVIEVLQALFDLFTRMVSNGKTDPSDNGRQLEEIVSLLEYIPEAREELSLEGGEEVILAEQALVKSVMNHAIPKEYITMPISS